MTRARVLVAGLITMGLLAIAGIAVASIPAPDGTINACYKNSTGALSVIDSASSCPNGTTPLSWSQTGPAGPAGPQGPAGAPGVSGWQVIINSANLEASTLPTHVVASCPSGKVVLGGGGYVGFGNQSSPPRSSVLQGSYPRVGPSGQFDEWEVLVRPVDNLGTELIPIFAFAICGNVT